MFKLLSALLVFAPIVLSTQLNQPSKLIPRQETCPSAYPVSCGSNFCRPSDASCCSNGHYCPAGQFCAPVVGYCCLNGEDPATCAVRQSFTLPTSTATTSSSATRSGTVTSAARSGTVTSSGSVVEFTGAAMKKDSATGVILAGAIGLMAAL